MPLRSELPQVMIHVQVAPSQPCPFGHRTEDRVYAAVQGPLAATDARDDGLELGDVSGELARFRTAAIS